jgi:small subunit ribosomal protein S2
MNEINCIKDVWMRDFKELFGELVKAGVHFGHQTSRWNPKMAPFIWGERSGVHLVDVSKTAIQLEKAAKFLESLAAEGKQILWVGTKKAAQPIVGQAGQSGMPYIVHRWIGGTLTNNSQVRKSVTKMLHFEDIVGKAAQSPYSKKELSTYQKLIDRLQKNIGGIRNLRWPIGAVVLVDVRKEQTALREAQAMDIPVVALVDTNCDPTGVTHIIPGNDDSPKAIKIVMEYLLEAAKRGIDKAAQKAVKPEGVDVVTAAANEKPEEIRIAGFEEVEEDGSKKKGRGRKKAA